MEIFDYLSLFKNCCDIDSLKKYLRNEALGLSEKIQVSFGKNLIFFPHFHLRLLLAPSGQI